MKKRMSSTICLVVSCLVVSGLFACAPKTVPIKPVSEESQEIKDIRTVDLPEKTQISVEGERPMVYTSFRLTDPLRLVLDLAGTTLGKYREPIVVNSGAVTSITPVEGAPPSKVARLEIGLAQPVTTQVVTEGTKLIVDVMKPSPSALTTPAAPEAPGSSPAPALSEETTKEKPKEATTEKPKEAAIESKSASVVTKVKAVVTNGTVKVTITGDGAFKPEVRELSGNRLVVDLPGTTNLMKPNIIQVNRGLLKRIRIGQHLTPKMVRVVLDLKKKTSYKIEEENNQVVIMLTKTLPVTQAPSPASAETVAGGVSAPAKPKEENQKEETAGQIAKPGEPVSKPMEPQAKALSEGAEETKEIGPPPIVEKTEKTAAVKRYVGRKISLDFQDADITNVLRLIADVSGFNIVLGDDVKGKVTVKLINVPWDQALDILLKMHGLGQVREGNIIRIATLANFARQGDEEAKAMEAKAKAEELVTKVIYLNYAKAKELAGPVGPLKKNLSPRGNITFDERTNTMILKDVPKNIAEISGLVAALDTQTPQVLIEARIVEASTSFARALGVQWGATYTNFGKGSALSVAGQGSNGSTAAPPFGTPPPTFAVNLPAGTIPIPGLSSFGGLGFTFGRFKGNPFTLDLRLSAGENQGLSKTISAPKVTVLENQEAKIEQGESIPFSSTSAQGTQTIFVDANLTLQVTPHVTKDQSILMKVKVSNNEPDFANTTAAGPPIKKKEATTDILMKDGDTTVIGGILINKKGNQVQGIPWFSKIPIIGWLFKTSTTTDETDELLVFLTPRIVK
jgi:type IV pilus assembly protein PilQ